MTHARTAKDMLPATLAGKQRPARHIYHWSEDEYRKQNAASHGDVTLFRQRMIERGMKVKQ